jgi:hypothetical protein
LVSAGFKPVADVLGVLSLVGICAWLYFIGVSGRKSLST